MTLQGIPRFLTTTEASKGLDLTGGVGQRVATFRYELWNGRTGVRLGEVTPLRNTIPVLVHNTLNTITRTLTGLNFDRSDTAAMNPLTDRIRPYMMLSLPDGSVQEFPLGSYMYSAFNREVSTGGDLSANSLFDEMFIIDQQLPAAFSTQRSGFFTAASFESLIERLLSPLTDEGLITYQINGGSIGVIEGAWPAGTSRAKVLSDICTQGGFFQPWFDNNGVMQIIPSFNPAEQVPDFDFDLNKVVFRDTISYTNDFLEAPNRYVVINSSGTTASGASASASGYYDIPPSAPWSYANRGFLIPKVVDQQASRFAPMAKIAQTIAEQEIVFERTQLSTAPDPRHDSYNVIRWLDANWMEISWSMQMQEGAPTVRTLRKAYQ